MLVGVYTTYHWWRSPIGICDRESVHQTVGVEVGLFAIVVSIVQKHLYERHFVSEMLRVMLHLYCACDMLLFGFVLEID